MPEVVEDTPVFDDGGLVDNEEDIGELTPVWQFTPRMKESKKAR